MPAKKILYLVRDYPQISQTYVETEIRELRPNYNIKIVSLGKPDINYNNPNPYERVNDKEELARAVLDFSPDIIHGHYVLLAPDLNWASYIGQVRYTIRAHSFDVLGSNGAKLLRCADTLNGDTCLGVLTLPFTRPLFERAGIRSEKIVDCYPVVDFARFHDVSRNGNAVMNTGACLPKKNMKEFLKLATMVQGKTFNLYALGYGVERLRGFNRERASYIGQVRYTIRAHSFDVLGSNGAKLLRCADTLNGDTCLGVLTLPFTRPLFERAGIRSEKIVDCYPVVDFARFHDVSRNGNAVMNTGACLPKKNMKEFLKLATMVQGKTFNLYALGYGVERLRGFNRELGNPVNIVDPIQPEDMCREYKKHEWLVYTSSRKLGTSGWPMAIAEAQAAGVGVCMQNIRPDLREYVGEAGFLFDTVDEVARIISQPFSDELRQLGFADVFAWV